MGQRRKRTSWLVPCCFTLGIVSTRAHASNPTVVFQGFFMLVKALYVILMLNQIGFMFWRPATLLGLGLSIYGIAFWSASLDPFFAIRYQITNYLFVTLALIAAIIHGTRNGFGTYFRFGNAGIGLIALYFYCWMSWLWSIDRSVTLSELTTSSPRLIAFAFLLPLVIASASQLYTGLLFALPFASAVVWLYTTMAYTQGRFVTTAVGGVTFGNPLAIASLGGSIAIIAVMLQMPRFKFLLLAARIGIAIMGLTAIIFVNTRGQLIAAVLVITSLTPFAIGGRNWAAVMKKLLIPLIFLIPILFIVVQITTTSDRFDPRNMVDIYQGSRMVFAQIVLTAWIDAGPVAWVIGMGSSACQSDNVLGTYPHLVVIEVLVELGVVGFTLFCYVLSRTCAASLTLMRSLTDAPLLRSAVTALAGLCLFHFIVSFKQGSLLGSADLWFCIVALSRVAINQHEKLLLRQPYPVHQPHHLHQ